MVLPIDDDAGQRWAADGQALLQRPGRRVPVVYLAPHASVALQLAAARAGGDDFLALPVDAPTVAARVERLLERRRQPPYRVLIVDDDEMLAERFQLTLRAAGMLVERVAQPLGVIPRLPDFRPDVLLMDLHMPDYSGAELARAIRYDETWQSLPIIFLSGESDLDLQHQALGSGGDDFLLKPIPDEQLVAAVLARALRARKVAELMSQDSLTGLLKHASIKDRLAQELERARRQGKPLAVAMVDIDYFKRINDRWGHPMGDQVIKTLGHLLRQRVRRQDSVGRYGGEEFLVILPECSAADALRLVDDIRHRFAAVSFQHQGQSFTVTLSAGIASSASLRASHELLAAADAALYQAKHGGRNQVVLASGTGAAGA
jgi:diguanylate cyclase (GGDEF)-like protein